MELEHESDFSVAECADFLAAKGRDVSSESVPSICSNVDLPAPEAPMMDTTSDFPA